MPWTQRGIALLVLLFVVSAGDAPAQKKPEEKPGAEWLRDARIAADLRGPGAPGFRLTGKLQFQSVDGVWEEGRYIEEWISQDLWRREIGVANHSDVIVVQQGRWWRYSSTHLWPAGLVSLEWLINHLMPVGESEATQFQAVKADPATARCFRQGTAGLARRAFVCFDASSGLLSVAHGPMRRHEISKYVRFGDKVFPQHVRILGQQGPVLEAHFEVEPLDLPGDAFPVPSAAESHPTACFSGRREARLYDDGLELLTKKLADMPAMKERRRYEQGKVTVALIVTEEGLVREPELLHSSGNLRLDQAVLRAVRYWRFKPLLRCGQPVTARTRQAFLF